MLAHDRVRVQPRRFACRDAAAPPAVEAASCRVIGASGRASNTFTRGGKCGGGGLRLCADTFAAGERIGFLLQCFGDLLRDRDGQQDRVLAVELERDERLSLHQADGPAADHGKRRFCPRYGHLIAPQDSIMLHPNLTGS